MEYALEYWIELFDRYQWKRLPACVTKIDYRD